MHGTNVVNASAAGEFLAEGPAAGRKTLAGARLVAGADAATAVIRETDVSGRILCALAAAAGTTDECSTPVQYTGKVFVVKTGTTPTILLYEG